MSTGEGPAVLVVPTPAPPPTPASPTTSMPPRQAARCHECHGPIAGYHQGYQHGLGACQLEHYDLCIGGITVKDRGGHEWKPCPVDYEAPIACGGSWPTPENDHDSDSQSTRSDDPDYSPDHFSSFPSFEMRETRSTKNGLGDGIRVTAAVDDKVTTSDQVRSVIKVPRTGNTAHTGILPLQLLSTKAGDKSEEDLLLEAELAELAIAETKEKKLKEAADVRRRREQTLENVAWLSRRAQGEGAKKKTTIHDNIDMLRTANRPPLESRRAASGYQGPTIDEIRRDVDTRDNVDPMMDHVYDIPSFSNANNHRRGQPQVRKSNPHPTQLYPAGGTGGVQQNLSGHIPGTRGSSQEETLYKWVLRRDCYGEQFKELVVVSPERPPAPTRPRHIVDTSPGWYYDAQTNRMYPSQTPGQSIRHSNTAGAVVDQQRFIDHRRDGPTPARQQHRAEVVHTPVRERSHAGDRFPGIVPLTSQPVDDREGKIPLSIASHARNLPMEYARSATSKNMNFAVFMYGAIHELHSSRIGITPLMPRGVLEAKLQHLMNVIHVTCLNATASDFKPVAWSVGRTYHNLVQAKVDSGREGWADFDVLHRGSPHAAEMVAAEREHREALLKKVEKPDREPKNKGRDKKDGDKSPCPTWNEHEEEGKCKWEAEHPGEKCNRSHHCSYCKKKNPALRTFHQARFCKRKLEEDK